MNTEVSPKLSQLSSSELLSKTRTLVTEERHITLQLIEHLREIDRRLLFADLGYGSLFEFATKHLGLSEGSAQRRIQAMRLVRDVPEAKPALEAGTLSLTNAAKVQTFFQMQKKMQRLDALKPDSNEKERILIGSPSELDQKLNGPHLTKQEILQKIQGLSQRECEQKLYEISPQSIPRERERVVSSLERELKIVITEELYQKLQHLKALLAHTLPEANYAELLKHMTELTLEAVQKKKGLSPTKNPPAAATAAVRTKKVCSDNALDSLKKSLRFSFKLPPPGVRGHIPRPIQRAIWTRAQGRCEYQSSTQRCLSRHRLEIDHQIPLAHGGTNDPQNLRLLCRTHNIQQARQKLRAC